MTDRYAYLSQYLSMGGGIMNKCISVDNQQTFRCNTSAIGVGLTQGKTQYRLRFDSFTYVSIVLHLAYMHDKENHNRKLTENDSTNICKRVAQNLC